jgi:hypothetical protein
MHKIKIYVLGDLFAYSKIYFKILKRINLNSFFNNFSGVKSLKPNIENAF